MKHDLMGDYCKYKYSPFYYIVFENICFNDIIIGKEVI